MLAIHNESEKRHTFRNIARARAKGLSIRPDYGITLKPLRLEATIEAVKRERSQRGGRLEVRREP